MSGDLLPISTDDMLAEVEREIEVRQSVYPRWVADKKLSARTAARRIEIMQAIAERLRQDANPRKTK